jgi:hypothetical protein
MDPTEPKHSKVSALVLCMEGRASTPCRSVEFFVSALPPTCVVVAGQESFFS